MKAKLSGIGNFMRKGPEVNKRNGGFEDGGFGDCSGISTLLLEECGLGERFKGKMIGSYSAEGLACQPKEL